MDRNSCYLDNIEISQASLSARRAWIEILIWLAKLVCFAVALRKESVDRNVCLKLLVMLILGRSPQGERG